MQDALDVMRTLKDTQDQMPMDDPNISYMLSSWARICQILGSSGCQDFDGQL